MGWTEKIQRSREATETKYGRTPTCVVVRQEVWGELCEENYGDYVFYLDGMVVAVSEAIQNPFEFKCGVEEYEQEE